MKQEFALLGEDSFLEEKTPFWKAAFLQMGAPVASGLRTGLLI